MQNSASQSLYQGHMDHPILLRRISRELDRFLVQLTQIEAVTSDIVANLSDEMQAESARCLQSIDYISQTSMSLSLLLTTMSEEPTAQMPELLKNVSPNDLRNRLLDLLLDDIDNTENNVEFF